MELKWDLDYMSAGQFKVQLAHNLKLMQVIWDHMLICQADCKERLNNTELVS